MTELTKSEGLVNMLSNYFVLDQIIFPKGQEQLSRKSI